MRQAILAAEDKNFYSHSGVDYGALPRVIEKTAARSLAEWRNGSGFRLRLAQGGSTITQQLVRVYFLGYLTARRDDDAVFVHGLTVPRVMSAVLGAPATNKLLRKLEEVRLALWLEEAMRKQYGTREQAKREIFARYASFIYMGSGRYGFGAASEYYFDKPLAGYTIEDAGRAALLAGIGKSPRDYAPVGGQLATAAAPQPDPGPDGPQRLHRRGARSAVPGRAGGGRPPGGGEDRGARGDRARARRAAGARRRALRGGGLVPGQDTRALHDRSAGAEGRQRGPGERARPLREAASPRPGARPGLGGGAGQRGRGDPGRGGRAADLQPSFQPLLRLQPRDRLSSTARLGDEAIRVPGGVSRRPDARCRGARRAHQRAGRLRDRGDQVDRQLRRPVQGPDPRSPGAGRVPQRGRGVDCPGRRHGQGHPDLPGPGLSDAAAPLHQHGARRVGGPSAGARGRLSGHGLGGAGGAARDRASHRQQPAPSSTKHREPPARFLSRAWP